MKIILTNSKRYQFKIFDRITKFNKEKVHNYKEQMHRTLENYLNSILWKITNKKATSLN